MPGSTAPDESTEFPETGRAAVRPGPPAQGPPRRPSDPLRTLPRVVQNSRRPPDMDQAGRPHRPGDRRQQDADARVRPRESPRGRGRHRRRRSRGAVELLPPARRRLRQARPRVPPRAAQGAGGARQRGAGKPAARPSGRGARRPRRGRRQLGEPRGPRPGKGGGADRGRAQCVRRPRRGRVRDRAVGRLLRRRRPRAARPGRTRPASESTKSGSAPRTRRRRASPSP